VTLCEGQGLQRLGARPEAFVGRSVFDIYPDNVSVVEGARRALAGETVSYVADVPNAVFDTWLAPLRGAGGDILGAIGVSTDITERHRLLAQLTQAERLASVGMLAAGVAHEINNPLAYVVGNLDLLAAGIAQAVNEPQGGLLELVKDARHGADRVRAIVQDLKSFSRVESRSPKAVDVRAALEATTRLARNEVHHRARLVFDLEPVRPVVAGAGRLEQLFLNLLVNAAQAIPEGAAEKNEIRIKTRDAGDWVQIDLSDTGAGIPRESLSRIFDPFFTTKAPGSGTGLGLSICHAIVTELGGNIEVDSVVGQGTTFRVRLPAATATVATSIAPRASGPSMTAGKPRGRVLVVDDEPLILKLVKTLLSGDCDVTAESSARPALERLRRGERFDVILCDLMMPDMTGIDLHLALCEIAPGQARAMTFLTGGAFTPHAQSFLSVVPNPTFEKPFDSALLVEHVRARLKPSR
jgi:signal transduction histidine kinase/CheY-like chemotaxis protein